MPEDEVPEPVDDEVATLVDPAYWTTHPAELLDALRTATGVASTASASTELVRKAIYAGVGIVTAPFRLILNTADTGRPPTEKLTYDVDEAAVVLGISRASAYEAVRMNQLPHIRIGRRILIPKAALDRLLSADPEAS